MTQSNNCYTLINFSNIKNLHLFKDEQGQSLIEDSKDIIFTLKSSSNETFTKLINTNEHQQKKSIIDENTELIKKNLMILLIVDIMNKNSFSEKLNNISLVEQDDVDKIPDDISMFGKITYVFNKTNGRFFSFLEDIDTKNYQYISAPVNKYISNRRTINFSNFEDPTFDKKAFGNFFDVFKLSFSKPRPTPETKGIFLPVGCGNIYDTQRIQNGIEIVSVEDYMKNKNNDKNKISLDRIYIPGKPAFYILQGLLKENKKYIVDKIEKDFGKYAKITINIFDKTSGDITGKLSGYFISFFRHGGWAITKAIDFNIIENERDFVETTLTVGHNINSGLYKNLKQISENYVYMNLYLKFNKNSSNISVRHPWGTFMPPYQSAFFHTLLHLAKPLSEPEKESANPIPNHMENKDTLMQITLNKHVQRLTGKDIDFQLTKKDEDILIDKNIIIAISVGNQNKCPTLDTTISDKISNITFIGTFLDKQVGLLPIKDSISHFINPSDIDFGEDKFSGFVEATQDKRNITIEGVQKPFILLSPGFTDIRTEGRWGKLVDRSVTIFE